LNPHRRRRVGSSCPTCHHSSTCRRCRRSPPSCCRRCQKCLHCRLRPRSARSRRRRPSCWRRCQRCPHGRRHRRLRHAPATRLVQALQRARGLDARTRVGMGQGRRAKAVVEQLRATQYSGQAGREEQRGDSTAGDPAHGLLNDPIVRPKAFPTCAGTVRRGLRYLRGRISSTGCAIL
jgi:hypothetical protein